MNSSLSTLLDLYQLTTGRRIFALQQMHARAMVAGDKDLAKRCAAGISHDRACLDLERRWEGTVADAAKKPRLAGVPDATEMDVLVDRTLTAIRDLAVAQAAGAADDDPIHGVVASFLKAVFPAGVHQVTSLPFVEELETVDRIVTMLTTDQAAAVKELALGLLTKRLAAHAADYRKALEAPAAPGLAFDDVRSARVAGQQLLLEAVVHVLAKHPTESVADVAARDDLLGPVLEQNDAIAAILRGRRGAVVDVHPDTGVPAPGPTGTPTGPLPPAKPAAA